ncbi:hypothetical protein J6590_035764 [Homalodisca vitripennis]|nr:hypothetical protein J6590_035764 [Homalodisca vitripennis]
MARQDTGLSLTYALDVAGRSGVGVVGALVICDVLTLRAVTVVCRRGSIRPHGTCNAIQLQWSPCLVSGRSVNCGVWTNKVNHATISCDCSCCVQGSIRPHSTCNAIQLQWSPCLASGRSVNCGVWTNKVNHATISCDCSCCVRGSIRPHGTCNAIQLQWSPCLVSGRSVNCGVWTNKVNHATISCDCSCCVRGDISRGNVTPLGPPPAVSLSSLSRHCCRVSRAAVGFAFRDLKRVSQSYCSGAKRSVLPRRNFGGSIMDIAPGQRAYEKSTVVPNPFVNPIIVEPRNPIMINTCLIFAAEGADIQMYRVTFYQPL